jgi:hypothetical protein
LKGNTGHVIALGVDVYQDSGLTMELTDIAWGYLAAGDAKNYTCYVFNSGNAPINLSLYTDAWQPPAAGDFLWLTWYGNVDFLALLTSTPSFSSCMSTPQRWESTRSPSRSTWSVPSSPHNADEAGSPDSNRGGIWAHPIQQNQSVVEGDICKTCGKTKRCRKCDTEKNKLSNFEWSKR